VRRTLAALLLGSIAITASPVHADEKEGVQHFRTGVRLFKDGNYAGALAEFEEAYRLHPTPSSLQNIALCQKALFRYADAIATLERMLREHAGTVSAEDTKAAKETIDQLRPLVTSVVFSLVPPQAILTVDGRTVPGGAERRLDLDVGEHRIVAEAPQHRTFDQRVTVAGREKRIDLKLLADLGELVVIADDAETAIAVDGVPRGYGRWSGPVTAEHHTVHIYKPGFTPTVLDVTVENGQRREVRGSAGERYRGATTPPPTPFAYEKPAPSPPRRGPYAFATATSYQLTGSPDHFDLPSQSSDRRDGSYFGVRLGYLLVKNFGLEVMFEGGKHSVGPGCYPSEGGCSDPPPEDRRAFYDLYGFRFGGNGRFLSGGETLRFVAAAGVGAVVHRLRLPQAATNSTLPAGKGTAPNAYLFFEAGGELSIRKVLIDLVITGAVDGVNNIEIDDKRVYTDHRNIAMGGVGLRIGYGLW
jgi:hypothetical protein